MCSVPMVSAALAAALAIGVATSPQAHGAPGPEIRRRSGPTPAPAPAPDLARLEAEIKEQRQIIIQMMQVEQQHYDLLLKLIQNGMAGAAPGSAPGAAGNKTLPLTPGLLVLPSDPVAPAPPPERAPRKAPERTATVTGKVELPSGITSEIYVFAENVHGAAARGRTIEIAQRDKQFVPTVAVVQRGTRVVFPNYDAVFHNVFSSASPHPFDLGSYRAGDSPRAVEMSSPGVVDVFCNMHSKMHASILVVPSPVWTRVGPDGTFRLENVPVGTRKLAAWSPRTRIAEQTIELGPSGGTATFTLGLEPERAHNNKYGLPYGSYKD